MIGILDMRTFQYDYMDAYKMNYQLIIQANL